MDPIWGQLALVAGLILLNAAFAGSEIALISLREGQLTRLGQHGRAGATLVRLAQDPNRFLATIQIGITLAGFLASATAAVTLSEPLVEMLEPLGRAARPTAIMLVTLALTFVTLVVGELAPKRVAMQRAEGWGLLAARPLAGLAAVTRPAVWLLGRSTDLVVRLLGGDPSLHREDITEEELRGMVAVQPELTDQERAIIDGAFELADRSRATPPRPLPCGMIGWSVLSQKDQQAACARSSCPARRSSRCHTTSLWTTPSHSWWSQGTRGPRCTAATSTTSSASSTCATSWPAGAASTNAPRTHSSSPRRSARSTRCGQCKPSVSSWPSSSTSTAAPRASSPSRT